MLQVIAWKALSRPLHICLHSHSSNLRVSWDPLDIEPDVWSYLEGMVEVVEYTNGEELSCFCR